MPKLKPGTIWPTEEEEAEIQRQIAEDPDDFEKDAEWFKRAQPAIEVDPELVHEWRRTRGKQKAPTKAKVTLRIDADIADHFRSSGPGWQTRLNDALRRSISNP